MAVAQLDRLAGDGHVDGLGVQPRVQCAGLQRGLRLLELFLDGGADVVGRLTHDRALFSGQLAHHLEHRGQLALLAEEADAQRIELGGILCLVQRSQRLRADLFQLFFHTTKISFFVIYKLIGAAKAKEKAFPPTKGDERPASAVPPAIRRTAHSNV